MTDKKIEKKYEEGTLLIVTKNGLFPLQQVVLEEAKKKNTEVQKAVNNLIKKIEGMAFDKKAGDITQEYQSVFLDGYNQAIEEVVEYLQSLDKGDTDENR